MNKPLHTLSVSYHSANATPSQYDKAFQKLLLKINVALNVNMFENQRCKIIYKDGNEIKSLINEITNFKNNSVFLGNNMHIELENLIDIKF